MSAIRYEAITPLYLALEYTEGSREAVVSALVQAGADANQPVSVFSGDETRTDYPIINAVLEGQRDVVRLLFAAGADIDRKGTSIKRKSDGSPLSAREIAEIIQDEEILALFAQAEKETD